MVAVSVTNSVVGVVYLVAGMMPVSPLDKKTVQGGSGDGDNLICC